MTNSADIYFPKTEVEKLFVKSIWRLQCFTICEQKETILPKGTVEIIFNLSDKIIYINPAVDVKVTLPYCFINGINFKPFHLIKNGQQIFLGIQLNSIALKALFNIPARELNDTITEGSVVCKPLNDLHQQLFSSGTFDEQVKIIRKWLCRQISASKKLSEIERIHNWFFCSDVRWMTVKNLHHQACISDRQLRRMSAEWLGMNTENFLLYNKYLSALHLLHNSKSSLTQIGLEAGYYDQSHFIREFKSYTDLTPKEYQASVTGLPGHIFL